MTHPPKKKHSNRPRPEPVVPLSAEERSALAAQQYAKALVHLAEAQRLADWGKAPNACVHSAYYAMEHCAAAVILAAGGVGKRKDFPKSHEHIIEHFGKLVEGETALLKECGKMLNRARTDRMTADYGLVDSVSSDDARETAAEAAEFVAACETRWRLDSGAKRQAPSQTAQR